MGLTPGIVAAGNPCGRLTLTSATPVLTATASAQGTVYLTPYLGNSHVIWDGTYLNSVQFTELSNVLANSATGNAGPAACVDNANYDLFLWNNAGTLTLTRGPLWSTTATVTTPVASPGVVNWTSHGLQVGAPVSFSGGTLPTGIVAGTTYYIIAAGFGASAFEIATTPGGSAINFTGTSSGTQTGVGGHATSRGTGAGTTQLTRLSNGIYVNTVAITNGPGANLGTYVGSFRTNSAGTTDMIFGGSAGGGTAGVIGVWNMYNRVATRARTLSSTATYTYSSNVTRQAEASVGMQCSLIAGLSEDAVEMRFSAKLSSPATLGSAFTIGIGLDNTTTFSADANQAQMVDPAAGVGSQTPVAIYTGYPGLGWHVLSANEVGDNSNTFTIDPRFGTLQTLVRA